MTSVRVTVAELHAALRAPGRPFDAGRADLSAARPAAVAVPIALEPEPCVHLVLRAGHLTDHAGELAFPGGKVDASDADLRATAAREMLEETGVRERDVEWLGELSPVPVMTTRYVIHPFVALLGAGVEPRVVSEEIVQVLPLSLAPYLSGEERVRAIKMPLNGIEAMIPHFPVGGRVLYGATAYITYELIVRIAAAIGQALEPPLIEKEAAWTKRYR